MHKLEFASSMMAGMVFSPYRIMSATNKCWMYDTSDMLTVIAITTNRDIKILQFDRHTEQSSKTKEDTRYIMLCPGSGDALDIYALHTADPDVFQEKIYEHLIGIEKTKVFHDKDGFIILEYTNRLHTRGKRLCRDLTESNMDVAWDISVCTTLDNAVDDMAASVCALFTINEYPCEIACNRIKHNHNTALRLMSSMCTTGSINWSTKDYVKLADELEDFIIKDIGCIFDNEEIDRIIARIIQVLTPVGGEDDVWHPFI